MTIKILSNKTINKISAGEVIERPASAVKEIVENAVDAGATRVDIRLERAGKNLIQVGDNGKGMNKEELQLAIQRHATSKLDEDDLLNINSFGFRGEALPSIGAVSRMKITSCVDGEDFAHEISVEGGEISEIRKAARPTGTTLEIRDLFFATPARLKFLRTDRTELNAIVNIVKRIALGNPEVDFSLTHEGKELISTRMKGDSAQEKLQQRVCDIIGQDFIENSCTVSFTGYISTKEDEDTAANNDKPIEITGYTSLPTYNRASGEEQYLFINNRPVKDKILQIALKVAYQDFMARDRFPVTALFLKIPPHFVDVNVHPAKTEVRFYDPNGIRSLVSGAIKDAVNQSGHRSSTSTAAKAFSYAKIEPSSNGFSSDAASLREHDNTRNRAFAMPSSSVGTGNYNSKTGKSTPRYDYALAGAQQSTISEITYSEPVAKAESLHNDDTELSNFPLGAAKTQLHETYIVSQSEDSIIIVDQHAAHERLGYEKIKEQMKKNGLTRQRLLIPEIIELPTIEHSETLSRNSEQLGKLGLALQNFGEKSVIVNEVPSLVGDVDLKKLVNDLADHLLESGENIALTELIEHITETYACHYAIRAGRKLNIQEMNELLRQMESTAFSGQCNHGRPTYVKLELKDVEKLFGRR